MILTSVRMANFRQFRGEHELHFPRGDEGGNVTVVFGENGRGKTGILRAILFALFGDKEMSQDAGVDQDKLSLINRGVLEDAEGEPVQCSVDVGFEHAGIRYELRRSLTGLKQGNDITEQDNGSRLRITTPEGNTENTTDREAIAQHVSQCIDPRVREYFFFDGEKIERLTRANAQQRQDVSRGIRNLLNIDTLATAQKALSRLHRKLNSDLGKKTGGEYGKTLTAINNCGAETDQITTRLGQIDEEIALAQDEKRQVDKELDGIKGIAGLLDERREAERRVEEGEEHLNHLLGRCKQLIGKVSINLVNQTLDAVYDEIEGRRSAGKIPAAIRGELLDEIIEQKRCICGRGLTVGSAEHERILAWKHNAVDDDLSDCALEIWRHLSTIRTVRRSVAEDAEAVLQNFAVTRNAVDQARQRADEISAEIGKDVRGDAGHLEKHREKIEKKLIDLAAERMRLGEKLEAKNAELEHLQSKRKEIEKQQGIRNELQMRADLVGRTHEALGAIYDEFTTEIKASLSRLSTERFQSLLDKEGLINFSEIVVNDDYSLQILDRWGEPFLANISAGQRQVMSISFILALAQLASGGDQFEMPLFMDTPFGRLSFANRRNLIDLVPGVCPQWILLATDTEIGKPELAAFREGGHIGSCYRLDPLPDGSSCIVELQLTDLQLGV